MWRRVVQRLNVERYLSNISGHHRVQLIFSCKKKKKKLTSPEASSVPARPLKEIHFATCTFNKGALIWLTKLFRVPELFFLNFQGELIHSL